MPVTRARPPTRQNGTSAPSRGGDGGIVDAAHRSTAAASAEPPPRPPPCGICLSSVNRCRPPDERSARRRGSTRRAARRRRTARTPSSRRRRGRRSRQRVGEVERHHLGVDQVVAVVAHADDAQATSVSLARSESAPITVTRPDRLGQRAPRGDVELLRARRRRRCRRRRTALASRRPAASGAASCAAGRTPCGRARTAGRVGRPGGSRRTISTSADSTFGRGTNTDAGTCPTIRADRPVGDLHETAP